MSGGRGEIRTHGCLRIAGFQVRNVFPAKQKDRRKPFPHGPNYRLAQAFDFSHSENVDAEIVLVVCH
jgi:hypothetical protein